jgi:hypothetical protein
MKIRNLEKLWDTDYWCREGWGRKPLMTCENGHVFNLSRCCPYCRDIATDRDERDPIQIKFLNRRKATIRSHR